jgi:Flp pilus assembly protein TadG
MFRQFFRNRRGNIAIMSSVMITSLVGVSGLVAEFGNGLLNRMQNQRIADAAAMAGSEVYASTNSTTDTSAAASRIASLSGSSATVSSQLVSSPSGDGNQAVEVTVQSSVPIVLAQLLWHQNSLPVTVSSYAEMKTLGPGGGSGCILSLDPKASKAITISGSGDVQSPNCDVISNSSSSDAIDMSG